MGGMEGPRALGHPGVKWFFHWGIGRPGHIPIYCVLFFFFPRVGGMEQDGAVFTSNPRVFPFFRSSQDTR